MASDWLRIGSRKGAKAQSFFEGGCRQAVVRNPNDGLRTTDNGRISPENSGATLLKKLCASAPLREKIRAMHKVATASSRCAVDARQGCRAHSPFG